MGPSQNIQRCISPLIKLTRKHPLHWLQLAEHIGPSYSCTSLLLTMMEK